MAKKGGGKGSFWDNPFGGIFDFNGDGKEDFGEQWLAYKIFEECTKEEESHHDYSSDYIDHSIFGDDNDDIDTSWREFCEDGSDFDLDPEDYETEEEYEEALRPLMPVEMSNVKENVNNESRNAYGYKESADNAVRKNGVSKSKRRVQTIKFTPSAV